MNQSLDEASTVCVTGIGPICTLGAGLDALWDGVCGAPPAASARDFVTGDASWGAFPAFALDGAWESILEDGGGDVDGDFLRDTASLPPDTELRLAIAALTLAIQDAALPQGTEDATGLVLSWEAPGIDRLLQDVMADVLALRKSPDQAGGATEPDFLVEFYRRHRAAAYGTHSFMHLHHAARALGLHGPTLFVNNACASGLYALEAGAGWIRAGKAERVLVAAAEMSSLPTKHLWFSEAGVLSASGQLRPFDRHRDGLVPGEGACGFVLERRDRAAARGATVYAEYAGGSFAQEAWKVAVPNLTEPWYERTLRGACQASSVTPDELDLLVPHGAGTSLGDLQEAEGITSVFEKAARRPTISAFKGSFGHTLGASAALETAVLLAALQRQTVPPSAGFATPDERLGVELVTKKREIELKTALKMSCGFGGFLAGAVFRRNAGG